jgi:hypothetical protein
MTINRLNQDVTYLPAFRNLIINGAMQVAQRGTSVTGITITGYYTADRCGIGQDTLGTWTQSVENDGPTGSGFTKSLKMLCTTASASPASNGFSRFQFRMEGQNLQSIRKGTANAQQLTLQFWVKSNVTGTYIAELRDDDNSRQVSAAYSIASSGAWEKKTIIFPADTTGVLDNDNASSLRVHLWLGAGTNFTSGTLNTSWNSTVTANTAVGQTNLAAATNNYWQVTGVQLEVGAVATPFEFKPFAQDLQECQRYYQVIGNGAAGGADISDRINVGISLVTPMRAAPTISLIGQVNVRERNTDKNAASPTFATSSRSTTGVIAVLDGFSGLTAGSGLVVNGTTTNNGNNIFNATSEL